MKWDIGLGNTGVQEDRSYNNMFQMTRQTTTSWQGITPTPWLDMDYRYTAGANNGRITSSVDWMLGETVNYRYDSLNRLASATATNGAWGQSFGYDGFGNLTDKTATVGYAPTFGASYNPATNHQNGVSYDANGNPDGGGTLLYDVENRLLQHYVTNGDNYSYDHAGKRVVKRY